MSDQTDAQEKLWKLLNLQADTMLKVQQTIYEPWKVMITGMTAGAALVGGTAAVIKLFGV